MTPGGDWAAKDGDFQSVADAAAVGQGVQIRCGMFLNECFLDNGIGIDWTNKILVKNADPLVVRAIFSSEISKVPDVTNVVGADLQDDGNRNASISYLIDTIYSVDPIAGHVGAP